MIDPFNRLRMEYKSIRSILLTYVNENGGGTGSVNNYLDGLKESIDVANKDDLLYYLDRIRSWYGANICYIETDDYIPESERREYFEAKRFLDEIYKELREFDFEIIKKDTSKKEVHISKKKIFLSHRSTDKKYADELEKLIIGLGVKNDQLIYTSHALHKIPLGEKIYDYLRKNINDQVFMIILWSDEYLESPACLGEMGAAWVNHTDYLGIYCPDFTFGNPKYHEVPIDISKMGAVLNGDENCKASMIEFKNKIQDFFEIEDDEQNSAYLLDKFIKNIKELAK